MNFRLTRIINKNSSISSYIEDVSKFLGLSEKCLLAVSLFKLGTKQEPYIALG